MRAPRGGGNDKPEGVTTIIGTFARAARHVARCAAYYAGLTPRPRSGHDPAAITVYTGYPRERSRRLP